MGNRLKYIDIAKGFAIISIVLLHFDDGIIPPSLNLFIGSFMISMFYVTTGWLDATKPFGHNSIKTLLKKRWKQLGVPYLWWTGIILAFDIILYICNYYDTYFIGREIYKSITLRGIGTLWFLPALFGGEIIWHYTRRKWTVCLFVLIGIYIYQELYNQALGGKTDSISRIIDAPFRTISNIAMAWVGIVAGYIFQRIYNKICHIQSIYLFIIGLALCLLSYKLANTTFPIPFLWSLGSPLLAPFSWLILFSVVQNSRLLHYFDYWGRNSLVLMVTHYSIVQVLCGICNQYLFHQEKLADMNAIYFFIIAMVLEYYIAIFINRKASFTLGK